MSLTKSKRELKLWRKKQRAAELVLASLPKPNGNQAKAAKFKAVNDVWLATVGINPMRNRL